MQPAELLAQAVRTFEGGGIPYFVTGALAGIAYGEPRLTNDIDIVADVQEKDIEALLAGFPAEEFYIDADSIRAAMRRKSQFNIIHPASGLKLDIMVPEKSAYNESRFERRRRLRPEPLWEADFAAPEDVILKKMQYYREGGSEKHVRDILGILRVSGDILDFDYLERWARSLGVNEIWERLRCSGGV
jgi:hypothetical protein